MTDAIKAKYANLPEMIATIMTEQARMMERELTAERLKAFEVSKLLNMVISDSVISGRAYALVRAAVEVLQARTSDDMDGDYQRAFVGCKDVPDLSQAKWKERK
jgi:uncharacterized tellurite resistance protein B-like protein